MDTMIIDSLNKIIKKYREENNDASIHIKKKLEIHMQQMSAQQAVVLTLSLPMQYATHQFHFISTTPY